MKLIFLLTCAAALMNFIHKTKADETRKYAQNRIIVHNNEECEYGMQSRDKKCEKGEKMWEIWQGHKINYSVDKIKAKFQLSIKPSKHDFHSCIVACQMNSECVGFDFDSNECYFTRVIPAHGPANGWTSFMFTCCIRVHPRKISNQPNHNLPIVFNTKTDCSPVVNKLDSCPPDEKIWFLEEKVFFNNDDDVSCTKLFYHQLNSGLNKCIDDSSCSTVLEKDYYLSRCINTKAKGKYTFDDTAKFLKLECCNFLNENLWTNRKRAIPILYDLKKMCHDHQAFKGQMCKIKVWKATDAAIMNAKPDLSIRGNDFGFVKCLEKCLKDRKCFAVDVAVDECHLYEDKKEEANLLYGYHLYTSYQLMCCNMKVKI